MKINMIILEAGEKAKGEPFPPSVLEKASPVSSPPSLSPSSLVSLKDWVATVSRQWVLGLVLFWKAVLEIQ